MTNEQNANSSITSNIRNDEKYLNDKISEIKENGLSKISPTILIKPAIFSFVVLVISLFLDLSKVPILGEVTIGLAKQLYPSWEPVSGKIEPLQFWWLPIISYVLFLGISLKEYKGLFSHVRATTPRENIDRIISSSMSLIDGYATALPLIGAAILLVSIKLGPEIFLGIAVPFEIKALIVLAIAKLFEPVLDYIGVKFQKVLNSASDFREEYYQKIQVNQNERLISILENRSNSTTDVQKQNYELSVESLKTFREELERIKTISFEAYQNFTALSKITQLVNDNLKGNQEHLHLLNQVSKNIDTMAVNLSDESVLKSLNSLELIVNKR